MENEKFEPLKKVENIQTGESPFKSIIEYLKNIKHSKGGFKKIAEFGGKSICTSSEHLPPAHIVLEAGVYEYTCPRCNHVTIVEVPLITF